MNCIKTTYLHMVVVLCALWVCQAVGEPNNGSFERFVHNESTGYNDPNDWSTLNVVTVVNGFWPDNFPGTKNRWLIDLDSNFRAFKGENLLVLSSGNSDIEYSKAWRQISISEGDKLIGVYFFGACDYLNYNDWAEIKLVPLYDSNLSTIMVAFADIALLGDYGSFEGWTKFEYTFSAAEAGDYNLVLFVSDKNDKQLESYLLVDSIVLCKYNEENPPPEKGDFNCDGTVDFSDFNRLANDWQYDCNSATYDPNCSCLLGSDIDGSGPVDFNDLRIFSDNWLCGIREEE
ncbi:MAG: hypothetical protein LLF92_01840 [Planctomycetaceae bacterium]|nr:hypothetical protein [Planctomycetaceae bacterium]